MKSRKKSAKISARRKASKVITAKVRARERDILKGIMENSGIMMAYFDPEFNFVAATSAYARGSGHTVEELIGKNHFTLFPNAENQAIFEKVRDTGETATFFDKPFEFADQTQRGITYWDWALAPARDEEGRVQGLILSLFETTKRKKAEEEVRAMSRFPSENPNPVIRISKDGTIQYCNDAGSFILDEWKSQIGQLATSSWYQLIADVFRSGTRREYEEEYGTQTFSFILVPIAEAGYVNIYGLNITERKKAEEALRKAHDELELRVEERTKELREASERLQTEIAERKRAEEAVKAERKRFIDLLEKLPAYLVLLTPDYHVSYANRLFRERFGDDSGHRCFEYLFGRTEPCEPCETYKTLKVMEPLEWEWTGPDGRNYYIYDSPFTDTDGSTLIMEVGIDITERKKAEEALRKAHDGLEMRVEERTEELTEASQKLRAEIADRKQKEEDLRQTRDYLENLFNYANAPIICWDAEFKITRFNHAFERLTGYKAEEVIGKDLSVLFPEVSREESLAKIRSTLTGERWEVVEIPIQRKDSEERVVLWNSANVYAADGKTLMATIAQGQDITERKRAEQALYQAKQEWERTFDSVPDLIAILDDQHRIVRANRAMAQQLGAMPEQCIGLFCYKCFHGTNQPPEYCPHTKTLRDGQEHIEELTEDRLGGDFLISTTPLMNEQGRMIGSVHVARNITQQKRAENELRETRDYLDNLLNYANAPIIVWNPQFKVTMFNHAFERLTGLSAKDVIGKPLDTLFPKHQKDEALSHIQRTLEGEHWETVEIPILCTGGTVKIALWNSANIYEASGKTIIATVAQGQDITERKQLQQKIEEYAKNLEQLVEEKTMQLRDSERLAAIGQTAGMVGHDIRNPLQSIEGAAYLAREELKSLPAESRERKELEEIIELIKNQTNYIDHIVADLQDFAKPPLPQPRETDIKEVISESLSMLDIPNSILVQTTFQDDLKKQLVDAAFLKRIFTNLIRNALQAMPNGGELTVKAFEDKQNLWIYVGDTGAGIQEENKPKIFTPLFTTKAKGQGFGLSVCKKLVEAHNGEITFESEQGKGTTFKIRIPAAKKEIQNGKTK